MAKMGGGATIGGSPLPPRRDGSTRTGTMQNGLMEGLNNLLPEKGSKARNDMVQQLVQAGMQSARGSTTGLTNFLAPLVGAYAGGQSAANYEEAEAARNTETSNALLGDLAGNPQAQSYLAALNDPNTPDHLRAIAKGKLDALMNPAPSGGSGVSAPRPSSNTDMLLARMLETAMGEGSDGGVGVTAAEAAQLQLVKDARSRSAAATSSGGSVVDELTGLLSGGGGGSSPAIPSDPTTDPLGLLN